MFENRHLFSYKRKYLIGFALFLSTSLFFATFNKVKQEEFNIGKREVLLRKIGHEVLLQSKDSTSRVFPLKKITENEYQIRFENDFAFSPDSLINITRRIFKENPLKSDYLVNVVDIKSNTVSYEFAISGNEKNDIIPCIGRLQPKSSYIIKIKFKPVNLISIKNTYLYSSLSILGFVVLFIFKKDNNLSLLKKANGNHIFPLGKILFDAKERKLTLNEKIVKLTRTESRVLQIFAMAPNFVIERSRLQKEIWEDEGIIVGRSLDMFISKLRKKLELDSSIKIVVVRSKGYKLELNF